MRDLQNPKLMWLKAILLLLIRVLAGALLLTQAPGWQNFALLLLCIWGFSRAYYFAFYVIEHYIDPTFKFAGLIDVVRYLMRRR
jgi:uncharacterized RDD family membrane protein YckC